MNSDTFGCDFTLGQFGDFDVSKSGELNHTTILTVKSASGRNRLTSIMLLHTSCKSTELSNHRIY